MTLEEKLQRDNHNSLVLFIKNHYQELIINPMLKETFDEFVLSTTKLDDAVVEQDQSNKSGQVTNKNEKIEAIANKCYALSRRLTLFAKRTKNTLLLNDVDVKEALFFTGTETNILLLCKKVITRGLDNIATIDEYVTNQADLNALMQELLEAEKLPSVIGVAISDKKTATQRIKLQLAENRRLLDMLDDGFEGFITDKQILQAWFDMRRVKGRSHQSKKDNDQPKND